MLEHLSITGLLQDHWTGELWVVRIIRRTDGSQDWTFLSFLIACWNWKVIPAAISVLNSLVSLEIRANYWRFSFSWVMFFFHAKGPGVVFLVKLQCCNHVFSPVLTRGGYVRSWVGVDWDWTWSQWWEVVPSCFLVNMIDDKMAQPINGY